MCFEALSHGIDALCLGNCLGRRRLIDEYSVVTDKRNAAEAWVMSAHKNGSSTVANGEFAGKSLREVYLEHPELGGKNCAGFSDFPVLIKFIDAAADLSVQVHPDDAYCLKKGSGRGKDRVVVYPRLRTGRLSSARL